MKAKPNSVDMVKQAKGAVFISYSKEDAAWKDRLRRFLKPLNVWNDTTVWADDCIDAGADWFEAIKTAINESAVGIMLVTTDFLGTEFIAKEEIPELLRLRRERGMWLIPVLVHACPWQSIRWLKQINIVPEKATPLDRMSDLDQDAFLSNLAVDIAEFLKTWQERAEPVVLEAPVTAAIDISHLPETPAALFGRDVVLDGLDADWESLETRVVAFVAQGGMGKSALINRWLHDMQVAGWRGAERVFGWSFYSQGARDQAATAEMFIDMALRFFDDPDPSKGSAWDKGERLAGLVAAHRTLLVLDGMEPLQSMHEFERGRLRDPGLQALLRRLTRDSRGLCLISTREPLPDLAGRDGFREVDLGTITPQDGRALLRSLRVVGTDAELEALAAEFGPRALSVMLLGAWLYEQPGHVATAAVNLRSGPDPLARILAGFEALLGESPTLELLRVQGLFDRPAPMVQIAAALDVVDLDSEAIARLRELRLLAPHSRHTPNVLEAHPLIREHYAQQVRDRFPDLFREAHQRLYEHLCETTEHQPDTLEGLQPLYQAVAHACQAGLHEQACVDVYFDRILRGGGSDGFYSTKKLGAIGADLGAVACFFDRPWRRLSENLSAADQAWLLNEAAYSLRALGRLTEAKEPMQAGLEMCIEQEDWKQAAIRAGNLSELELTLGEVSAAMADAGQSVTFADRTKDAFLRIVMRTTHADAMLQAGRIEEARGLFGEAETMQAEQQPEYPRLYSLRGFQYCDLLLSVAERAAWQVQLAFSLQAAPSEPPAADPGPKPELLQACDHVIERATQTLRWAERAIASLLTIALNYLTLGRAALYWGLLNGEFGIQDPASDAGGSTPRDLLAHAQAKGDHHFATENLDAAVNGLREAGMMEFVARGLLTRAWQRHLTGDAAGVAADLDEAWEMAERGPMPLYQADILLTRARLFFRDDLATARENLAKARDLIQKHGYLRRDEELEDAEEALGKWEERKDEGNRVG